MRDAFFRDLRARRCRPAWLKPFRVVYSIVLFVSADLHPCLLRNTFMRAVTRPDRPRAIAAGSKAVGPAQIIPCSAP